MITYSKPIFQEERRPNTTKFSTADDSFTIWKIHNIASTYISISARYVWSCQLHLVKNLQSGFWRWLLIVHAIFVFICFVFVYGKFFFSYTWNVGAPVALPASISASSMKWVVSRITRPSRLFFNKFHRWRRENGSIPADGSSRNTTWFIEGWFKWSLEK